MCFFFLTMRADVLSSSPVQSLELFEASAGLDATVPFFSVPLFTQIFFTVQISECYLSHLS